MRRLLIDLLAACSFCAAPAPAAGRPNVLFLIADDLRPELGAYGHPTVRTPHIDAIARAGVRFDAAYCQFPLCCPSRTSLLTGRYPIESGVLGNRTWFGDAHPDYVSLPAFFKRNGYATLRSGKIFHGGIDDTDAWTEGGERRRLAGVEGVPAAREQPQDRRSDSIRVVPGDGDDVGDGAVAGRAIDLLRRHREGPFFLAVGFSKPHSPPEAPQRYFDLYDPAAIPLPGDFAPRPTAPAGIPPVAVRRNTDLFIDRDASPEQAREMIRAYWASLSWMDHNVGRVVAELERLGLRGRTIVVFWGDHGYHLGEKGRWSKAGSLFEVGTRVPFVIDAPGARGNGRACGRVVEVIDLYRTLADLAGLPAPADGVRGSSLATLLTDPDRPRDRPAFSVWAENGAVNGVAVRRGRFRYAEWDGPRGGPMLFDLEADPHERTNLADDPAHAATRSALAELVRRHRAGLAPEQDRGG